MKNEKVKDALIIVEDALRSDKLYYSAWLANIAMAFSDAAYHYRKSRKRQTNGYLSQLDLHLIGNEAADNFLQLLISSRKPEVHFKDQLVRPISLRRRKKG